MNVDLDRAEQLATAATHGPWTVSALHTDAVIVPGRSGSTDLDQWYGGRPISESSHRDDAEFIAAARQLVPALVARVRELIDAGNRMAEVIHHPENHGQDWHNDARWAADAWRSLTADHIITQTEGATTP